MLRTSKHEREALYATRKKLNDALNFLRKQGFSDANIFEDLEKDGFCNRPPLRDDFGIPKGSPTVGSDKRNPNPFVEKMKQPAVEVSEGETNAHVDQVFEKKTQSTSAENPASANPTGEKKSWTQVLNDSIPKFTPVKFDFIAKAAGHLVGACPKVTRQWVRKEKPEKSANVEVSSNSNNDTAVKDDSHSADNSKIPVPLEIPVSTTDGVWHEVKRKHSSSPGDSIPSVPPPQSTAASSLPIYSALSRTISKSQRKKAKKSGGKGPSIKL
ncbi:hypothetical protein ACET3Z_013182 [Daucus carota]